MKGSYDNVAAFYDFLSRFVFGDAILLARLFLVSSIPPNSSILIVGGGTGQLLEEIAKAKTAGLTITYVEISNKMICRAKKRNNGDNQTLFINQSILDVSLTQKFNVVITPFLFDNFSCNTAKIIFGKINASLTPGGLWLFADFQLSEKNRLWQKLLLNLMYFFFRLLCKIEAKGLPDTFRTFSDNGFIPVARKTFYNQFICSVIYQKAG